MHSFTTERLLIRPLAQQDKELYLSLYCDAKVMRNIGEPLTVEAAEKAFASTLRVIAQPEPKILTWTIVDKATNEAIGLQALNWITPNPYKINLETFEYAEIGFMLLRQSNGKRIPKEAAGALIDYAFNHLKLQRINTFYSAKNLTVAKLAYSLGFSYNSEKQPLDENQQLQYIERQ